jgi:tetratricopeptide (TPR) repeat protein
VWDYLNSSTFSTQNNLLNTYVKVNIALDYRKSDAAIEILQPVNTDAAYQQYPVFYYQIGVALLNGSDKRCINYFRQFIDRNKSGLYVKDCWQKLAFAGYITGDMAYARFCRQQIKLFGTTKIDADKQAEKFADGNTWPLKSLLQARLYIEGGYYNKALDLLNSIDAGSLTNPADKAEYFFRLGRVNEESESYDKALECYRKTISTGKNRSEQFAARAALQVGRIYEHTGRSAQAINSYRECLDMPAHDFQNSIDQQAKAGINRIEGK